MGDMRAMTAVAGSQAALLELSHVGKVYGGKGFVTTALDDVSLVVRKGEFVAIMGPSGSGKSTLLNCVATIDSVTSGHITLGGRDVTRLRRGDVAKFRRYELGFVFQDSNLLDTQSGKLGRRRDPMRVLVLQGSPNAGSSTALLAVAWNDDDWTFDALEAHYDTLVRYLCLRDCGRVLGGGCGTPGMTARTGFPKMAYELGRGL